MDVAKTCVNKLIIPSIFKDHSEYKVNNMESNKEVISRLKFIARIQKGDKINTRDVCIQPAGILTSLSRIVRQDSRCNTLNLVQSTIYRSFELLLTLEKSEKFSDKIMCVNIANDLRESRIGLENLKETYLSDIKFCCDMDTLMQYIDAKLKEIEDRYPPIDNTTFDN
jgi:hypothetical protein